MVHEKQNGGGALRVGIDLGTSRSAISSSAGDRVVVDSFVGWPADLVARKVLKRDILFGRDALDNRTMVALHRPLERGLLKEGSARDVDAARELLQHLLSSVGVTGSKLQSTAAVIGVPATALRASKQQLRGALKGIVNNLMIVSEPFAVAYGLDALVHTMIVDIGAGTTDFCVMRGRYPADDEQRSLTVAGDSIDTQLQRLVQARHPSASFTIFMVREWKEKFSFVGEPSEPVTVTVPVNGTPTPIDITDDMKAACESIVPPIVESIIGLLARVEPEFQERVRRNIILSGGGALIRNLGPALEKALERVGGGSVKVVDAPVFLGSDGALALARDAQDGDWERLVG